MDITHLGNKQLMGILKVFISSPSIELEQSRLEKITKFSRTTVIKWVNFLIKNEIIDTRIIGRTKLLKFNNESIKVKEIKRLSIILSLEALEEIVKKTDTEIYLYGSCARGEYYEESDVDIIIIGNAKRSDLVNLLEKIGKSIKRTINFRIFSNIEWSQMRTKDKAFYDRVEKDKIRLG